MFKDGKRIREECEDTMKNLNNSLLIKLHRAEVLFHDAQLAECTVNWKHINSINFFTYGREHHF